MRKSLCFIAGCAVLMAGPSFAQKSGFSDVPRSHWAYAAVQELSQKKIVRGEGGGKFNGNKPVTRFELAMTLAKFLKYLDIREKQGKAAADKSTLPLAYKPFEAKVETLQGTDELTIDKGWREGTKPEMKLTLHRQGKDVGEILLTDIQEHKSVASIVKVPMGIKPGDRVYLKPAVIRPTRTGGKALAKTDPAYEALVWLVSWGYAPPNSKLLVDGDKPATADETASALGRAFSRFLEKGDVVGSEEGMPEHEHSE